MKEDGIRFLIVEEGFGGSLEYFSEDDVHTVIRYCPQTGSISKAVRREGPPKVRDVFDPKDYMMKPTLSRIWDITFVYKSIVHVNELAIEYIPHVK